MKNRLKLDFTLETAEERNKFIQEYIGTLDGLTAQEAETIANYLLWGKTTSGKPLGVDVELETKWTKTNDLDSLDALVESATFNDLQIRGLNEAISYKKPRVVFDRGEVRRNAPDHLIKVFEELWTKIDETELLINFFELKVGKRTKPPREQLLKRVGVEREDELRERASRLNQYQYLKLRHELIELRREQFSLQDSYKTSLSLNGYGGAPKTVNSIVFDCDVEVFPLGIMEGPLKDLIFGKEIDPAALNEEQLWKISDFIQKKIQKEKLNIRKFDFRDLEAVYQLYLFKEELLNQVREEKEAHYVETNLEELLNTLEFYEECADLNEVQKEILGLKVQHWKNQDIADYINKKYGKSYTANYISTIFKQKIIVKINEAAQLHKDTIENFFFPENFKRCTDCGRLLLLDGRNWVKKSRSKDGFQNRCKRCERELRQKKKGGKD